MSDLAIHKATHQQQADLGKKVAALKTLLHDVENHISAHNMNLVDWEDLVDKNKDLAHHIESLMETAATVSSPPPAAPTPPPPSKPKLHPGHRK